MDKLMRISGVYALISAIAMAVIWVFILLFGAVSADMAAHPLQYYFLIGAEILTAVLLFISGVGLLKKSEKTLRLFYIAMGMLLYAVIFATGKFLSLELPYFSVLFVLVSLATAVLLILNLSKK